jgi:cytochrome b561
MQQVSPMATRYDGPTIWFHWAVACLVLVQWLLAQVIDWFPLGMPRIEARSVHISLGLFLGVLTAGARSVAGDARARIASGRSRGIADPS